MSVVDLSRLPVPDVVQIPNFETLLAERKAAFLALYPLDERDAVARTLDMESEPVVKLLQESTYREIILRQRINEAAQAVMVAYALNADLDNLAAGNNVKRLIIKKGDADAVPPVPDMMESDSDLRARIPAAFEGMSVAGPTAAYQFHAMSADGRVADATAISPTPANVTVTVLSRDAEGKASDELLQLVDNALNAEDIRPVADRVKVQAAEIIHYAIDAVLYLYHGPEIEPIMIEAKRRLQAYVTSQRRLGRDIRLSAIYAALHVEGVQRVELITPTADIVLDETQASFCDTWTVKLGGLDE